MPSRHTALAPRPSHGLDLVEQPQKLGFLPTLAYWRQPSVLVAAQPLMLPGSVIAGGLVGALATFTLPLSLLTQPLGSVLMGSVAAAVAIVAVPGLIEAWVRRQVEKRRSRA